MNRSKKFLGEDFPPGSYHHTLQKFLRSKERNCSVFTLDRLYYNLFPIGQKAGNPSLETINKDWLIVYIDTCWLRYAPETMRTLVGDVRLFFKWGKKRGYHSQNIAKGIRPVGRRRRRHRRAKAASEADIKQIMEYLANQLKADGLVYRDLFGIPQVAESDNWTGEAIKVIRDLFILTFLYETGARVGELCKLGSVTMDEAIKETAPAYLITLVGKTGDRDYLFTGHTAELWKIWQQVRPNDHREYAIIGWGKGHHPAPLLPNGVSHMLIRRCQEARITKPFRTHALRHAKVKRSRKLVGLDMASRLIDHSDVATTRGYGNADEGEINDAAVLTGLQFDIWLETTTLTS